jgi:hypothetical protein
MANYAQNASPTISNFKIFPCTPAYQKGGEPPSRALPHLRLQCLVRAFGTQLSPYFIN